MFYLTTFTYKNVYIYFACAQILFTLKNHVPCFEDSIKSLINGLSLRVVSKPNLLCKVRFEVFRNISTYPWIKTKPVKMVALKIFGTIPFPIILGENNCKFLNNTNLLWSQDLLKLFVFNFILGAMVDRACLLFSGSRQSTEKAEWSRIIIGFDWSLSVPGLVFTLFPKSSYSMILCQVSE